MTKDTPCDTVEESEEIIRDLTEKNGKKSRQLFYKG